jgi:selenocysteine lyase/cysteine desulfurase
MILDGARHFENFDGVTYLNCAYMGPLPRVTLEAIREVIPLQAFPNRVEDSFAFDFPNRVREVTAPFVGARPEDILVGSGSSHGMAVAALGFPWKAGDEVIVSATDFPSNVYIWSEAARRNDGVCRLVRGGKPAPTTEDFLAAITERTRIISVSWIDYGSGEIIDLERLGEICAKKDIFLAVDATQAVGALPLDARAWRLSLVAVGAYKWMLGPYGAGFAYLDPAWAERIAPTYVTWTAAQGAEDYNALPRGDYKWVKTARRYDEPETASFLNRAGLIRSAQFLSEIGVPAVHAHITDLLRRLEDGLPRTFRRRAGPSRLAGPILSIEADDVGTVRAAYTRLREQRFRVSLRDDGIRVSPHIYNTEDDIDRFLSALRGR